MNVTKKTKTTKLTKRNKIGVGSEDIFSVSYLVSANNDNIISNPNKSFVLSSEKEACLN